MYPWILPKNEGTNSFFLPNSNKNEFVCRFLEESEDTKKSFRNYLTFRNIYSNSESSVQFLKQNAFLTCSWKFFRSSKLSRTIRIQIGKKWDLETNRTN